MVSFASNSLVRGNAELLRLYVKHTQQMSDLWFGPGNHRVEMMLSRLFSTSNMDCESEESPDSTVGVQETSLLSATDTSPSPSLLSATTHSTLAYFSEGMPLAYLLATAITGLGLLVGSMVHVSQPEQVARSSVQAVVVEPTLVGRITGMVDCKWEKKGSGFRVQGSETENPPSNIHHPTSLVSLGDKYALASGLMEITYDTGAKVILQGPVTYSVEANGGYLLVGKLTGKLEKKNDECKMMNDELRTHASDIHPSSFILHPFSIRTPTATVTDLGTEFGVEVSKHGITKTHVFVGEVQIVTGSGQGDTGKQMRVISAGQSARVGHSEAISVGKEDAGEIANRFVRVCRHRNDAQRR